MPALPGVCYHKVMDDEDELLDLFDADERIIGTVLRADYHENPGKYPGFLRSSEVLLQNDKGELWIPRRTLQRNIAPGGLDYSAGGYTGRGETYMQGLLREAEEELRLKLDPAKLKLLHAFRPTAENPWFRQLFLYHTNTVPPFNRDDFSGFEWLRPAELLRRLEAGEPCKSSMTASIKAVIDQL